MLSVLLLSPVQAWAQAATTTTLSISANPVAAGQNFTVTATVTSSSVVNEGTITFIVNGVHLPNDTPVVAGQASRVLAVNGAGGSFSFTAQYNGTANFSTSTSSAINETVDGLPTATTQISSVALTETTPVSGVKPVTGSGTALTYSISPSLPAGLTLSPTTGTIAGTPTATSPATTYTVTVTDSVGQTASAAFQLTINSALSTNVAVTSATVTVNHTITNFTPITGSGGTAPFSYSIVPSLPSGLNLNSSTGEISGTPAVSHSASSFTVTVTDANGATASNSFTLTLTVNGAVTATQAIASIGVTLGRPVTPPLTPVTGGGGTGSLSYSVSPSLPSGLTMDGNGAISGTPTATSAAATYTVTVTDTNSATATNTFSLAVNSQISTTVAIPSTVLTANHAAASFTPLTVSGGSSPLTYSISPSLPAGLSFANGAISGTPTTASARTSYTMTITDPYGSQASNSFDLTVNGSITATQAIAATALTVNRPATSFTPVTGSGGTGALTYGVSPSLPAGLSFSTTNGAITGTPSTTLATATFTVTITDTNSATATATFTLTVNGGLTATTAIPSTSLVLGRAATSFTPVTASGGTSPLTYSVSPALPAGLSFNSSSGAITGTPGAASPATSYTVTVTDTAGATASAAFSLTVGAGTTTVALTSSQNPSSFGQAVTFTATVSGSGGTPGGTVTFNDSGAALSTATLSAGVATFSIATLKTGTHAITAVYAGNGTYSGSTSPGLTQTVSTPADSVKLHTLQANVTKVVGQGAGQIISSAIDGAIADGFAESGSFVTPGPSGIHFNFAADSDSQNETVNAGALRPSLAGNPLDSSTNAVSSGNDISSRPHNGRIDNAFAAIDQSMQKKTPPKTFREQKDWLFWIDIRGTGINRMTSTTTAAGVTTAAAPLYGHQVNALLGMTYKVSPALLVGVLGGYETFNYTEQDINGKLTGGGWTVGSYLGWRITPTLRYDAAVAYSGIGYDGASGTAQGSFSGQRWMVSSGLTGNVKATGFDIEPSAKVYALWEHEGGYTDSLGTQQADHNFSSGRASGGTKVTYPVAWSDTIALAPYLGVYGDYYFDGSTSSAIAADGTQLASTPLFSGWSARVTGGLGLKLASGGAFGINAEYGGIGSDFEIWTFTAKAQVPF